MAVLGDFGVVLFTLCWIMAVLDNFGVVPYGERSARFDRWTLKHPWRAAVLGAGLPLTLLWLTLLTYSFARVGLGSAVLVAVVAVVEVTVGVIAFWRFGSQPSNFRGLQRWEAGQH